MQHRSNVIQVLCVIYRAIDTEYSTEYSHNEKLMNAPGKDMKGK